MPKSNKAKELANIAKIHEAVHTLLITKGFEFISYGQIAATCGMSRSGVGKHLPHMEDTYDLAARYAREAFYTTDNIASVNPRYIEVLVIGLVRYKDSSILDILRHSPSTLLKALTMLED